MVTNRGPQYCNTCKRPLDQPDDKSTEDCGGDCLRCMAMFDDPDCVASMRVINRDQMKAAIEHVRAIIIEGAQVGFNPMLGGDWAQRLFESQAITKRALDNLGWED